MTESSDDFFIYELSPEKEIELKAEWLKKTVEERYNAIEFLVQQWVLINDLSPVMDKTHFYIRK